MGPLVRKEVLVAACLQTNKNYLRTLINVTFIIVLMTISYLYYHILSIMFVGDTLVLKCTLLNMEQTPYSIFQQT